MPASLFREARMMKTESVLLVARIHPHRMVVARRRDSINHMTV